ncbi:MAG: Do family serine endopeptidase [Spirochaetaceae bacterium]|nr:MAG: Do family serine endopeptidase [Spirochaetaceae bacterium]
MIKKAMHSRNLLFVNLVLVGLIAGFSLSMVVFSCSTRIQPGDVAYAQETGEGQIDLSGLQSSFREISQRVRTTVVKIEVEEIRSARTPRGSDRPWFDFFFGDPEDNGEREFRTQGLGSGVIVRKDGNSYYVLTNDHVIGDAAEIQITLDDEREFSGTVVGKDARKDLALVSFETSERDIPVAVLGDSSTLQVGDWVLAIGSPFGFQSTVTAGIVSATGRRGGPQGNISDFIQTDAAINQGNSGGALVNLKGEVVGINTWITSRTGGSIGLGFSIPINNAKRAIVEFIESGSVQYGWLGVSIQTPSRQVAEDLGVEGMRGALVHHVFRDSPADRGGILPGDFITSVNGRSVRDSDALILAVGELPAGRDAEFELVRDGREMTLSVRITVRDDEQSIAEQNRNLWPGLTVFPLTEDVRRELELGRSVDGVLIAGVQNGTPAAIAGLRVGDVIKRMNGGTVRSVREFYRQLNDQSRREVEFEFTRDGQDLKISISR